MPKYRAHLEFDAPDHTTAWMMGQRFARNAGSECTLVNVQSEERYFTDVPLPDGPGFEKVRTARAGVDPFSLKVPF